MLILGQVADGGLAGYSFRIDAKDRSTSARSTENTHQNLDERSFPRAVRGDEREDGSLRGGKIEAIEGPHAAETLCQGLDLHAQHGNAIAGKKRGANRNVNDAHGKGYASPMRSN